jgi:hypothetical protein
LYLPNAEITLDLEVNEVEVKVLTSLASVVGITGYSLAVRGHFSQLLAIFAAEALMHKEHLELHSKLSDWSDRT